MALLGTIFWTEGLWTSEQKNCYWVNRNLHLAFLKNFVAQAFVSQQTATSSVHSSSQLPWARVSNSGQFSLHQHKDIHPSDYHIKYACFLAKLLSSTLIGRPIVYSLNKLFFLPAKWSSMLVLRQHCLHTLCNQALE